MRLAKLLKFRSIRAQLLAAYVLALLLASAVATLTFYVLCVWLVDAATKRELALQAEWIEQAIVLDQAGRPVGLDPAHSSLWIYASISDDLKYAVLDEAGKVLFSSGANGQAFVPAGHTFMQLPAMVNMQIAAISVDLFTMPVKLNGVTHYIQVVRSERLNSLVRHAIGWPMLKTAVWVGAASLLMLVCVVYLTLRRSLRPLHDASEAAARIEPANLSRRLETAGLPTELRPLVQAFNEALDRLERGFRVQQEFLAGAAHELKTPLALIRSQLELDATADRASLLADVDMMARQVHQLLQLAEVSEAANYVFEPVDLAAVARDVVAYLGRLADMGNVSLSVVSSVTADHKTEGDRSAIFVLLKNLVENAIRHSQPGGTVGVVIGEAGFYVQDSGRGIAPEHFPNLFTRFWRGPDRRDDGAGLGLSICQQIAATHRWTIDANNASSGARFAVNFPRNQEAGKSAVIVGNASWTDACVMLAPDQRSSVESDNIKSNHHQGSHA